MEQTADPVPSACHSGGFGLLGICLDWCRFTFLFCQVRFERARIAENKSSAQVRLLHRDCPPSIQGEKECLLLQRVFFTGELIGQDFQVDIPAGCGMRQVAQDAPGEVLVQVDSSIPGNISRLT